MSNQNYPVYSLNPLLYESTVRRALREDLGRAGDITSSATVPPDTRGKARIIAKKAGCIAGLEVCLQTFRILDPNTTVRVNTHDGCRVQAGSLLSEIEGSAQTILSAERTALNFLGHLSGIATETFEMNQIIASTKASIACTRKTTPGLRALEKYAVRVGGGRNHRFGLDDAVLIKENHIAMAGGIGAAIENARRSVGHMVKIEIEVENLEQLDLVLNSPVDAILLDNMSTRDIAEAVKRVGGRMTVEVSGGLTRDRILEIARTGVDLLSLGWITHSAPSLDVSLYLEPLKE